MTELSNLEVKSYLKWSTRLPRHSVLSPVFEVRGAECYFRLFALSHGDHGARYSIRVEPTKYTIVPRLIKIKKGRRFEIPRPVVYDDDSYTTLASNLHDGCPSFNGEENIPVTFIVDFGSDVKPKSGNSEPGRKRPRLASDSIQIPCLKALSDDFGKLLGGGSSYQDVLIRCHDRTVAAHKVVLMSRSKVFEAMLRSNMVEGRTGQVEVKDMDAEVFLHFLTYLYSGALPELSEDRAKRLYEAGDRYVVESLMQRCSAFLVENLTIENACDILDVAETHCDSVFKEAVVAYILEKKIPLMDQLWKPFSSRRPLVAVDIVNRFIKLQAKSVSLPPQ